jgi:hypothetical protein
MIRLDYAWISIIAGNNSGFPATWRGDDFKDAPGSGGTGFGEAIFVVAS